MNETIRPKERDTVLQSLRAGVVPRTGQRLIQVGRAREIEALVSDIERVSDSGSAIRLVIGDYGSGKTFFLHLVRAVAMEKKLVAAHADLTPERRLYSTEGHARTLYAEMMRNMSTRSKPDGGALPSVIERFVSEAMKSARATGTSPDNVIHERLNTLMEMTGGYDFAHVISQYWKGHDTGNEQLKADAVRWLRAEFSTKTEARQALGVRTIIDDSTYYDHLKLMSLFVRLAGFAGFLVCFDEMVNLFKMANTKTRNMNYEQILRIINDSLQGTAAGLGILMGGTPEFLMDTRRGLYSYQALQSRLAENTFAAGGLVDYTGPVIRLPNLSPEDIYILIGKIRHVFASGDLSKYLVPDISLKAFLEHCSKTVGDAYFRTPRNTIKAFVNFLAVLEQNPGTEWQQLIGGVGIDADAIGGMYVENDEEQPVSQPGGKENAGGGDDLATFRL